MAYTHAFCVFGFWIFDSFCGIITACPNCVPVVLMFVQKVALAIFGLTFSLLLLELVSRYLPQDVTKTGNGLVEEERIFTASRGMKFEPNFNRVWTGLGRPTIWAFNDLGYRERGIQRDKPEGVFRILFIGDSVVMGFGVEEYESLPRQLEDVLRPIKLVSDMFHVQVLNLGIQGYSTSQYLAVLQ